MKHNNKYNYIIQYNYIINLICKMKHNNKHNYFNLCCLITIKYVK